MSRDRSAANSSQRSLHSSQVWRCVNMWMWNKAELGKACVLSTALPLINRGKKKKRRRRKQDSCWVDQRRKHWTHTQARQTNTSLPLKFNQGKPRVWRVMHCDWCVCVCVWPWNKIMEDYSCPLHRMQHFLVSSMINVASCACWRKTKTCWPLHE